MSDYSTFSLLIRANRQRRDLMKPYYAKINLTAMQVSVLICIADHPGRMQKEIAEDLGVSPTALVGILRYLEERGLIACARKSHNRRAISVYSTQAGDDVVDIIRLDGEKCSSIALEGFTAEQIEQLDGYLARIIENCQRWQEMT